MTDQKNDKEVYDMAEHFKEIYEKKELEVKKLKEENCELKKLIMTNYGLIRVIDNLFDGFDIDEDEHIVDFHSLQSMIEISRAVNSKIIDDLFLTNTIP